MVKTCESLDFDEQRIKKKKMILEWNSEVRRRKRKSRKQWMAGVRSMLSKDFTEDDAVDRD